MLLHSSLTINASKSSQSIFKTIRLEFHQQTLKALKKKSLFLHSAHWLRKTANNTSVITAGLKYRSQVAGQVTGQVWSGQWEEHFSAKEIDYVSGGRTS